MLLWQSTKFVAFFYQCVQKQWKDLLFWCCVLVCCCVFFWFFCEITRLSRHRIFCKVHNGHGQTSTNVGSVVQVSPLDDHWPFDKSVPLFLHFIILFIIHFPSHFQSFHIPFIHLMHIMDEEDDSSCSFIDDREAEFELWLRDPKLAEWLQHEEWAEIVSYWRDWHMYRDRLLPCQGDIEQPDEITPCIHNLSNFVKTTI